MALGHTHARLVADALAAASRPPRIDTREALRIAGERADARQAEIMCSGRKVTCASGRVNM